MRVHVGVTGDRREELREQPPAVRLQRPEFGTQDTSSANLGILHGGARYIARILFTGTQGPSSLRHDRKASRWVAVPSARRLVFKFVTRNFMSRGADIAFLSLYPAEQEALRPPGLCGARGGIDRSDHRQCQTRSQDSFYF